MFPGRITRYVTVEILRSFLVSLAAMTCLMILVFLFQEGMKEKLTLGAVLRLVPYTLPTALCFAIPGTILFSVCVCYGRMTSDNEITSIKAAGISPMRIMVPALVIATLLSLATVWLNDIAASWGRKGVYRVILNTSAQTIYSMLGAQGTFKKGKMFINVDRVEGQDLVNPFIVRTGEDHTDMLGIRAQLARIVVDVDKEQLIIRLKNAHIKNGIKHDVWFDQTDIPVPLGDVSRRKNEGESPSVLALSQMKDALTQQENNSRMVRYQMAAHIAADCLGGNIVGMTDPQWGEEFYQLRELGYRENKLRIEPWRRWANGFSCLAFVIVGTPLSILMQRYDFWTNFAICFIPVLLFYYPLLMYGVGEAKSGSLPAFSVWLGNVVMIVMGAMLLRKVQRS